MVRKKKEVVKSDVPVADGDIAAGIVGIQRSMKNQYGRLRGQLGDARLELNGVTRLVCDVRDLVSGLSENCANKVSDLAFECLRVTADRDGVKSAYEDLTSEYEDLKVEYDGLKEKFAELVEENDALREEVAVLKREGTLKYRVKRLFHLA